MTWVAVGLGGLGAAQGMANQEKMKRHNKYRAEAIKYSPWTGMGDPGEKDLPGVLQSALQGAAMGATLGQGMGGSPGAAGAAGASGAEGMAMASAPTAQGRLGLMQQQNPYQFPVYSTMAP